MFTPQPKRNSLPPEQKALCLYRGRARRNRVAAKHNLHLSTRTSLRTALGQGARTRAGGSNQRVEQEQGCAVVPRDGGNSIHPRRGSGLAGKAALSSPNCSSNNSSSDKETRETGLLLSSLTVPPHTSCLRSQGPRELTHFAGAIYLPEPRYHFAASPRQVCPLRSSASNGPEQKPRLWP